MQASARNCRARLSDKFACSLKCWPKWWICLPSVLGLVGYIYFGNLEKSFQVKNISNNEAVRSLKEKSMSDESTSTERKGDRWVDAIAAVVLLTIFISTAAYWVASQS